MESDREIRGKLLEKEYRLKSEEGWDIGDLP